MQDLIKEWQPIETAPKDGRYFLAWSKRGGMIIMVYHNPMCSETFGLEGRLGSPEPTHWMLLPSPPQT